MRRYSEGLLKILKIAALGGGLITSAVGAIQIWVFVETEYYNPWRIASEKKTAEDCFLEAIRNVKKGKHYREVIEDVACAVSALERADAIETGVADIQLAYIFLSEFGIALVEQEMPGSDARQIGEAHWCRALEHRDDARIVAARFSGKPPKCE